MHLSDERRAHPRVVGENGLRDGAIASRQVSRLASFSRGSTPTAPTS